MVRFDQDQLLDRLAARGKLDIEAMPALADAVARFHAQAEPTFEHGGRQGLSWVIEGNAQSFAEIGAGVFDREACDRLTARFHDALSVQGALLDDRKRRGLVRRCHGDLHLRNIVLIDGLPTLFDGVEFNDEIACGDVLYDLAFLLMDLWRRALRAHANVVFNEYLGRTDDLAGLAPMPLFLACRAAVRAKTSATAARMQEKSDDARRLRATAPREYLDLAGHLLNPPPPAIVAVGGWSGSGKSTMARRLAPAWGPVPGAAILRSDVVRKRLFGVDAEVRLDDAAYTPQVSHRVYDALCDGARRAARAGHTVIVDAVHARPEQREAIAEAARSARVPFIGVWLDAPGAVLLERLRARTSDVSDATPGVLRQQLARDIGSIDWHRIDASGDAGQVEERIGRVREQAPGRSRRSST